MQDLGSTFYAMSFYIMSKSESKSNILKSLSGFAVAFTALLVMSILSLAAVALAVGAIL